MYTETLKKPALASGTLVGVRKKTGSRYYVCDAGGMVQPRRPAFYAGSFAQDVSSSISWVNSLPVPHAEINLIKTRILLSEYGIEIAHEGRVPEGELIIEILKNGHYFALEFYSDGVIAFSHRTPENIMSGKDFEASDLESIIAKIASF